MVFTILLPYDATQSGGTADSGKPAAEDDGVAWQRPAASSPGLGPASDDPHSWPPGYMRRLEGSADLDEVGEDALEEQRGRRRSEGVRGRGATRAEAARRGGRRGVAVGRVEERVEEAARVLSYDQAAAMFFCLEEGEEELMFRPVCKREGGNK